MSEPRVFNGVDSVKAAVGEHLGYSDWMEITQERVNTFAEATGDYQWIHIDVERAKDGPFGGTIAHGYLTLSLCARFLFELCEVQNISMGINYGVNKGRFPAPVRSGVRIRARGELAEATEVAGGVQAVVRITVESEGSEKPAAVIETVSRYLT
jgi:acyl dehydratase